MSPSAPYHRTEWQKTHDFKAARDFESYVAAQLGDDVHVNFDSPVRLDVWVPGYYVEVKEKRQRLTERWHILPGTPEQDLFVIDELTVRRSLSKYPGVFFLIRDVPGARLFLAPVWELIACRRARVDRVGKGKWVLDMTVFRQIESPAEIRTLAPHLLAEMGWLRSECLAGEVGQV